MNGIRLGFDYLVAFAFVSLIGFLSERHGKWWYKNVPQWVAFVCSCLLWLAVSVLTRPLSAGLAWMLVPIAHLAWLATMPIWLQIVVPPIIIVCIWIEARGLVYWLPMNSRITLSIVFFQTGMMVAADHSSSATLPIWMYSVAVAMYYCAPTGFLTGALIHGRQLGFWTTFRRFFDMGQRIYGPGHPLGDHPPKWHGWGRPAGYGENDPQPSDIFGDARVASIEEMKKGGLIE